MMNREIALAEQRNRIVNASRAYYTISLPTDKKIVELKIENKRNTDIDINVIRKMIDDVFQNTTTISNNFEIICDLIYNTIATNYPERDIEVKIYNNLSNLSFTKSYNTTKN